MGMKYLQDLRVDKEGSDMNVGIYQIQDKSIGKPARTV